MSKNEKAGRKHNPNRPRSKNGHVGKGNGPQIDWAQYNRGRRDEGQIHTERMRKVDYEACHIMGMLKGRRDWRVPAILAGMVKSEEDLSCWSPVRHFKKHPDDPERELYRPYSRAQHQLHVSNIKPRVQHIITWMAGEGAVRGTKIADSGGYSMARYTEWQNAEYGRLSVHDFSKLHAIRALHGKICAAMVTPGKANDSPHLRKMAGMVPPGSGDVPGDAAYGGIKNCNAIRNSGRRPIMECKSNAAPKGFNARAEMPRFREEHPRTFHSILRTRNNVESVFDEGGGVVVRALRPHTRAVELPSMRICYNMAFA